MESSDERSLSTISVKHEANFCYLLAKLGMSKAQVGVMGRRKIRRVFFPCHLYSCLHFSQLMFTFFLSITTFALSSTEVSFHSFELYGAWGREKKSTRRLGRRKRKARAPDFLFSSFSCPFPRFSSVSQLMEPLRRREPL